MTEAGHAAIDARFEIRENNQRWKLFDKLEYWDVSAHKTREEAEAALARMHQ